MSRADLRRVCGVFAGHSYLAHRIFEDDQDPDDPSASAEGDPDASEAARLMDEVEELWLEDEQTGLEADMELFRWLNPVQPEYAQMIQNSREQQRLEFEALEAGE